jgi:hypothetical protein
MNKIKIFLAIVTSLILVIGSTNLLEAQRGGRGGGGFSRGGYGGAGFGTRFSGVSSRNFNSGGANLRASNSFRTGGSLSGGHPFWGGARTVAFAHVGFAGGRMYRSVPRSFLRLRFGGYPYYFNDGLFYGYYGGYYGSIFPPLGISINALPYGYWAFNYNGFPYFYHSGIYYRQQEEQYQVVEAPVGASVPKIPKEAKVVLVNNEKYFEYNGTYYKEYVKEEGTIWYEIAGLHGVLNTTAIAPVAIIEEKQYNIGDIVDALPADCKSVIINNRKYFVANGNLFFEELIENNILKYKVVGK